MFDNKGNFKSKAVKIDSQPKLDHRQRIMGKQTDKKGCRVGAFPAKCYRQFGLKTEKN